VEAFSTALSGVQFSLKNPESLAPVLYLTMVGLTILPWFVSIPSAWTIQLDCSFPIV